MFIHSTEILHVPFVDSSILSNIYGNWLKRAATSKPLTLSNCSRQEVSSCCRTKPISGPPAQPSTQPN